MNFFKRSRDMPEIYTGQASEINMSSGVITPHKSKSVRLLQRLRHTCNVYDAIKLLIDEHPDTSMGFAVLQALVNQGGQIEFKLEVIGENCDKDETDVVADNYVISVVKVSGDISLPTRQKNYNSNTITFGIGTPAAGEKAIDWTSAVKSERTAVDAAPDATLASLSIGSLTLSPAFAADTTEYTATIKKLAGISG